MLKCVFCLKIRHAVMLDLNIQWKDFCEQQVNTYLFQLCGEPFLVHGEICWIDWLKDFLVWLNVYETLQGLYKTAPVDHTMSK